MATVLVVEDNEGTRKMVSAVLGKAGYDVEAAPDGKTALALMARGAPDLILQDMLLPDIDGFELVGALRALPGGENVPIIAYSGFLSRDEGARVSAAGFTDLLVKPVEPARLVETIKSYVPATAEASRSGASAAPRPAHRFQGHLEREVPTTPALVQQCSARSAGLSVLSSISDALARSLDIDTALGDALGCCLEAGGISMGAVFLAGRDGKPVLCTHSGYADPATRELQRFFGHSTLLELVLESDTAAVMPGEGPWPQATKDLLAVAKVESAILLPLVLRGERLGVLFLASETRDMTDPDWLAFGRTVAVQIAQAIALTRTFQKLVSSEQRSRKLMEHANDAIFLLDPRGKVLEVNHRAEELLGRPGAELAGRILEPFRDLAQRDGARIADLALTRPDGRTVYADASASVIEIERDRYVLVIARDSTERKRAQEERDRLYAKANEAVRARDEFLDAASKALKDPVDALVAQVKALPRRADDPLPEKIEQKLARLSYLVSEVSDVSRIAAGRLELHPEKVDLAHIVRDVAERFASELARGGCQLTVQSDAVVGLWDRLRVEQVLANLLANAIQYAPGKPIQITVDGDESTGRFSVADRGTGIAPSAQAKIFERSDTPIPGRSRAGLGLGLWIARQIVDASRGTIRVASRPGKGSVFTVTLPRA